MLSKLEEMALVALCVATDDRKAFSRLVDEHAGAVRNFLFRLTVGDAALTDDISQEVFIKAWSGLRTFKAVARFRTWLLTIAYNEFISYTRKTKEERMPDILPAQTYEHDKSDGGNRLTELRHDIQVAMTSLNATERTLIILFYMEDRPIKEICNITGLPSGTVKSYLSRAKNKMAQQLHEYKR